MSDEAITAMTKNHLEYPFLILLSALAVALGACVDPTCPEGTVESEGRCVEAIDGAVAECLATCSGATPICDSQTGRCVGCVSDANCSGDTPACSAATRTCVACTRDAHCEGDSPKCDVAAEVCVGCLDTTDCSLPTAPSCNAATATCGVCTSHADCARFGATPDCDSGTCVACTAETEALRCGANSCNALTNTCTTTPRRSLTYCSACTSNSECPENAKCARQPSLEGGLAFTCLYNANSMPCGAATRPYANTASNTTDVEGRSVNVCYSSLNACGAVTAYFQGRSCSVSSPCPDGGTCDDGTCTILCANENGCRVGDVCVSANCVDN